MGSVLSDYTKPNIIRRNKDGVSSGEESDEDQVDGGTRMSGDGGSNEDGGKRGIVWHMHIEMSIYLVFCRNIFVCLLIFLALLIPLCTSCNT